MPKKGYRHPINCQCKRHTGNVPGHPHTEKHKKYMAVRIKELRAENDWLKGKKHPLECKHCIAVSGENNYNSRNGSPLKGRKISGLLGPPIICPNGCGEYYWPRGISKHTRVCDGYPISDYYGLDWNKIRKRIYERDNWTCKDCGKYSRQKHVLVAHHVVPYRVKKEHKEENLVTLCRQCHRKRHLTLNKEVNANASED